MTHALNWTLSRAAEAVDGHLFGNDLPLSGVSTDTRQITAGSLFIALAGVRFDAHDFLAEALAGGAAALLVSARERIPEGANAIVVDDTRLALGRLAAAWRAQFAIPVIAVTGSNGKTTTKEMIAAILRATFGEAVLATRGNLNNDIGLPLTLLGLNVQHKAAVIEMGMNHPGEIAYLASLGAPTVAVITNAQRAHLEGMVDLDEVAREKGSIFSGLSDQGIAVINADDRYAGFWAKSSAAGRSTVSFGLDHPATVHGVASLHGLDTQLSIRCPQGEASVALAIPGRHNARNALAAAAACLAAGVPLSAVSTGLSEFRGIKGRLQRRTAVNGATLLDDTYNANPDSMKAGIDVLASTIQRKVLVVGDMGETGEACGQLHDEIGGYARSQGIDRLFALGDASKQAVRNFGDGARHFCNIDKLVAALKKELDANTAVLVKGSRFMKMERVVDAILAEETATCC